MSKQLEDFIRANREEFDDLEPRLGLWNKIEAGLNLEEEPQQPKKREAKTFSLNFVLRMAAIIIVTMGVGFMLYIYAGKNAQKVDLAKINPEYAKQQVHYASLVESKRTELKQLAKTSPELYHEFSGELAKMDSTYNKLKKDLVTSPNQERVLRAMIRNLQVQTEVLNQQLSVIEQYNEFNNQQPHETKSI